jgi:LDH2 family malate/lactate/ureidoglycolate dehydrogenase
MATNEPEKNQVLVGHVELAAFVTEVFARVGLSEEDAAFHAKALVDTNLWGVDSHGVLRVPVYVRRMQSGAVNPQPKIQAVRGSLGLGVLDGDDGPGFIVGRDAMQRAIELAEQYNIGAVGAVRSNHFGATAIYTRLAAERGMIGMALTNVVPNVVAPGGSRPVVGNNPLSIAVPTFGPFPFVLDISLSAVAGGKLLLASKKGEKIPLDWATDKEGRPTDDPDEAFAGFLLPMGGYKGLGLAYAVDILCGVITGGMFLQGMKGMYKYPDDPSLTGHFMIAVNVEAIMGREEMQARMAEFTATIKGSPMWDESREMLLPGEIEHRTALARTRDGIPLPPNLYEELVTLGRELGVSTNL